MVVEVSLTNCVHVAGMGIMFARPLLAPPKI
jgi:hypothetical protein